MVPLDYSSLQSEGGMPWGISSGHVHPMTIVASNRLRRGFRVWRLVAPSFQGQGPISIRFMVPFRTVSKRQSTHILSQVYIV